MNFIITGASRGLGEEFAKFASQFGGIVGIIAFPFVCIGAIKLTLTIHDL